MPLAATLLLAGATASTQSSMHFIAMDEGAPAAATRRKSIRRHRDDGVERGRAVNTNGAAWPNQPARAGSTTSACAGAT